MTNSGVLVSSGPITNSATGTIVNTSTGVITNSGSIIDLCGGSITGVFVVVGNPIMNSCP